tara:strand:+ start:826 stop:1386 length:561 start_codon:yes stop_codon:yes gene_type:complete
MFVQTEQTPNPNTLKFLPGKKVSEIGPIEFTKKNQPKNKLVEDLFTMKEISMVFLGEDFLTVKKEDHVSWDEVKPKIISFINEYYLKGNNIVISKDFLKNNLELDKKKEPNDKIEKKIIEILDKKIRPAVARDGGDIKFKSFKDGLVTVELQGSCSGCPSSIMTLKQGVQNLLCHYISEVKRVEAV